MQQSISTRFPGEVALVGAGPGDPELITRKGWRLLLNADLIVYDALVSAELMAEIPGHIARHYVGKRKGQHSHSQADICRLLVQQARLGKRVVRLKGGDPLIFGRLTEELDALQAAGIPFTLVPGITAASGCAASCGLSLTERGIASSLRFITASHCDQRSVPWADLTRRDETLVFYMGLSQASRISQELQRHGLPADWPVMLIERGTQPDQRSIHTHLAGLPQAVEMHRVQAPALILIGKVARQTQEKAQSQAA